jgi:hypothetical protein
MTSPNAGQLRIKGQIIRHVLTLVVVVALGCVAGACNEDTESNQSDPVERECIRVRDHLIEIKFADISDRVDRKAHAKAMEFALGADFVTRCSSSLTPARRACVLAAGDSESAAQCSQL